MLPFEYRLRKNKDFRNVYGKGKSRANYCMVLYTVKNPNRKTTRIGFSVSKRLGSAVVRNRIKRKMREAIRPHLTDIKSSYDIIFIARNKIKGISLQDVEKNMMSLLHKTNLLNEADLA